MPYFYNLQVALNNANVSIEYIERLCDSTLQDVKQALPKLNANEYGKLESCLSGLSSVTINLKDVISYGIQQLRASAIKPRVGPWVDAFLNINHQLDEASTRNDSWSLRLTFVS